MGKHDGLFELVKSMSQSEKRYFRIFASRHVKGEQNQYMKIFSALDRMEAYDDALLKKKFDKEKVPGNVSRNKTYLKNLILKSLVAFHSDHSARNRIKEILRTVEILYNKDLGDQCKAQLEKAEKMALENEEFLLLLEINYWKRKIIRITEFPEDPEAYFIALREDREHWVAAYQNASDYNGLASLHYLLSMARGGSRSEAESEMRQRSLNAPLLQSVDHALSNSARIVFHNMKASIHINHFEYTEAAHHIEESIRVMEAFPAIARERPGYYLQNVRNLIWVSRWMGNSDVTRKWIAHLKKVTPEWIGPKVREANVVDYFSNVLGMMDFYKDSGESHIGLQAVEEFQVNFERWQGVLRDFQLISFHFMSGVLHFEEANYRQAVKSFNEVINFPNIALREDLHCMTRILLLLSHLELGNTDLLEYLVKSAIRFLEKKKRLYNMEAALLHFIRKDLLDAYATPNWKPALKNLQADLKRISDSPFEGKALKYFNFIAYFEAHLQGKTFKRMLQEMDQEGRKPESAGAALS